jgi:hypothetical protein
VHYDPDRVGISSIHENPDHHLVQECKASRSGVGVKVDGATLTPPLCGKRLPVLESERGESILEMHDHFDHALGSIQDVGGLLAWCSPHRPTSQCYQNVEDSADGEKNAG